MRWRNLIILLIVTPLVLYGGLKGYLWYSLKSTMDNVQRRVADSASVSYEEIQTKVLGPIGFKGVTYRPHGFDQSVRIQAVLLDWDEHVDLLPLLQAFWEDKLPEKMTLTARNISIPVSGGIADWWDNYKIVDAGSPFRIPQSLLGCGIQAFTSGDLLKMGYETIESDLRFEYNFGKRSPYVTFYSRARNHDMMTLTVEGSIPSNEIQLSLRGILHSIPLFANLSISLDNEAYNARKIKHCAKLAGISPSQFVDKHVDMVLADLDKLKVHPSDELVTAYRQYLTEPATKITVNLNPYEPLGPDTVNKIDHKNFVDWLGVEIIAGESLIKELTAPQEVLVTKTEQTTESTQEEETFRPTPVAELDTHLSKLSRIQTRDGKTHYAYLEQVGDDVLTLTQHLVGGSATFTIEKSDIVAASVLY